MITAQTNLNKFNLDTSVSDIGNKMLSNIIKKNIIIDENKFQQILDTLIVFKDKTFNRCWIAEYLPYWYDILKSNINNKTKIIKFLQIGVFEGMSLLYLSKVIFADYELEITVIDDFSTEQYFNTEGTFDENMAGIKIRKLKKDSHTALIELINNKETFDFIYCCGSRKPFVVYVDFALLTKIISDESMILLDDYQYFSSYEGDINPDLIKNIFTQSFKRYCKNIPVGQQNLLIFRKIEIDKYTVKEKPADCINRSSNKEYEKYKNKYKFLKNKTN